MTDMHGLSLLLHPRTHDCLPHNHCWLPSVATLQDNVGGQRARVETYLLHSLGDIPADAHHSRSFRLLRSAGAAARPTLMDLLSCAAQPDVHAHLRSFNPYLSDASCARLWQGVLLWLQLCVLEDKLERLGALASTPAELEPTLVRVRAATH
jgi:hypothetical protein